MIIAPCIGGLFDRFSKKTMSISVDICYALLLIIATVLFAKNLLDDLAFLVLTILSTHFPRLILNPWAFLR